MRGVPASRRQPVNAGPNWFTRNAAGLAVLAVLVFVAVVRLRLADAPLDRDEGEYAYAGRLLLQGSPPYTLAYNMKFPGTYYAYAAVFALFGQSSWGIHAGLLVVNAACIVLIFVLGRAYLGRLGGAASAAWYGCLSLDRGVFGTYAHATHFIVVFVLLALVLVNRARESPKYGIWFASGISFGLALIMSQQGAFFLPLGVVLAFSTRAERATTDRRTAWMRAAAVAAGAAAVLTALCALLAAQGVLSRAAFWTLAYARAYVSEVPWSAAGSIFGSSIAYVTRTTWPIWLLAAGGVAAVAISRRYRGLTRRSLVGLLVCGLIAISPGFYYRSHYFVMWLPAIALLAAVPVVELSRAFELRLRRPMAAAMLASALPLGLLAAYVAVERRYLFSVPAETLSRETFGADPFNEARAVGAYLESHTTSDDKIAVLGSEPEIYFYAHRESATGYIYMYPLLERQPYAQSMQLEMLDEIQTRQPAYLVVVSITGSWFNGLYDGLSILDWTKRYSARCYDLEGVIDLDLGKGVTMVWDEDARTYHPHSQNLMVTFKRKGTGSCRVPAGP